MSGSTSLPNFEILYHRQQDYIIIYVLDELYFFLNMALKSTHSYSSKHNECLIVLRIG